MSDQEGIVVAKHALAAEVGASILEKGGNAFDAAVAVGFTLAVVEPYMSGIGGGKFQLVYRTSSGTYGAIDAPVICPLAVHANCYDIDPSAPRGIFGFPGVKQRANEIGYRSVAVPGVVAGLCLTLALRGTKSLEEVIQPAIDLADRGFSLSWLDTVYLAAGFEKLMQFPATAAIFLPESKVPTPAFQYPLQPGYTLQQRDLASSLRLIAEHGPTGFYRGALAAALVEEVQRHGGWLSLQDLASYEAREAAILTSRYRDWELVTGPDFPVLEALQILEHFDLSRLGHNSPETLHLIAEACQLVHADYYHYLTSPEGRVPERTSYLESRHTNRQAERIGLGKVLADLPFPDEDPTGAFGNNSFTTTGYSAADGSGNVVTALQTHGWTWGSGVTVEGTGILLNDQMLGFNPEAGTFTSVGPGKTRPIPGWPLIGRRSDGASFALSSPGGNRVLCALVQAITNIIDFDMPVDAALSAPRIDAGSTPGQRKTILCDNTMARAVREKLANMGHALDFASPSLTAPGGSFLTFAHPGGVSLGVGGNRWVGGNDPPTVGKVVQIQDNTGRVGSGNS